MCVITTLPYTQNAKFLVAAMHSGLFPAIVNAQTDKWTTFTMEVIPLYDYWKLKQSESKKKKKLLFWRPDYKT